MTAITTMCTSLGNTSVARARTLGKIGPYTRPTIAVENIFSTTEFTNHIKRCIERPIAIKRGLEYLGPYALDAIPTSVMQYGQPIIRRESGHNT